MYVLCSVGISEALGSRQLTRLPLSQKTIGAAIKVIVGESTSGLGIPCSLLVPSVLASFPCSPRM